MTTTAQTSSAKETSELAARARLGQDRLSPRDLGLVRTLIDDKQYVAFFYKTTWLVRYMPLNCSSPCATRPARLHLTSAGSASSEPAS